MRARWVIGNTIIVQIRETAGVVHRPVLNARQQNARRLLRANAGCSRRRNPLPPTGEPGRKRRRHPLGCAFRQ